MDGIQEGGRERVKVRGRYEMRCVRERRVEFSERYTLLLVVLPNLSLSHTLLFDLHLITLMSTPDAH